MVKPPERPFYNTYVILSVIYFNRITEKKVKLSFRYFQKGALISILTMTIWVLLHKLGETGLYRIDNVLVNIFWSIRRQSRNRDG